MLIPELISFEGDQSLLRANIPEKKISRLFPERNNKITYIKGIVKRVEARTVMSFSSFYCNLCGKTTSVVQELPQIVEPSFCTGKKKCSRVRWSIDSERSVSYKCFIYTIIEERGSYNEKITVYSFDKLKVNPGSIFEGVVFPKTYYSQSKKTNVEYCISVYEVEKKEPLEGEYMPLIGLKNYLTENQKREEPILNQLTSIFSDLKGSYLDSIKKALIYQIISSSFSIENSARNTLNILLVGEPGTGKSTLLKRVSELCSTLIVNGSVSTSAGVIAACVKSEKQDSYYLEAGSCLLSNRNVLCIDELDKSKSKTIIEELHEPMQQGTISFNKAGLHLKLESKVAFLIAMNPEKNLEGAAEKIFKTKYLTNSFLNRFDLLFYIKEENTTTEDSLEMITNNKRAPSEEQVKEWKRKIAIIKSFEDPVIPLDVANIVFDYYKFLEQNKKSHFQKNEINQGRFLITMRQREALERLSKCIAKSKLRTEVTIADAKEAIELSSQSIYSLFNKSETNENSATISIEKEALITKTDKIKNILELLIAPCTITEISKKTLMSSLEVEMIIKSLVKSGQVFIPRIGYYERIGTI